MAGPEIPGGYGKEREREAIAYLTLLITIKLCTKRFSAGAIAKYYTSHTKTMLPTREVRAKIQQAIGPHEDLLTIVNRRKLQWYGHVSRSSGLAKTIFQRTVKGGRRQGRQRKRWDKIRKWKGLEFGKSQRAVENREKWRKLVVNSSVVP